MKGVVKAVILIMILLQTITIIQCIDTKSVRREEIYQALSEAEYATLEMLREDKGEFYFSAPLTEEQLKLGNARLQEEFEKHLRTLIASNSKITIEVYGIDCEKGLIDAEVTAEFQYPIGKKGEVRCRKTVILEEY